MKTPCLSHRAVDSFIEERIDPVNNLPKEVSMLIFSYLSGVEIARSCLVSKQWRELASDSALWNGLDLRGIFSSLEVFDESDWATHVDLSSYELSVEDVPVSDKRKEIPVLKRLLSSLSIEGNAGVTLLTIPKGLTFNKLVKLARLPKLGNATHFRYISARIPKELRDIAVDETYRIVITNNILEASRNLSVSAQRDLAHKFGCEIPKLLEVATLLVVLYMNSQQRPYKDTPRTYTRCAEEVDGDPLVVGGLASNGLNIYDKRFDFYNCGVRSILHFV